MNNSFETLRSEMVASQIQRRGLSEPRLLDALRTVPRHCFVPAQSAYLAYEDMPLPIGLGQTISQPYMVALMTDLLRLSGSETVLEIGTGSGYQAAVLACLARSVHTIERHADLVNQARRTLAELGYANIAVHEGDGSLGWPEASPYQGILVTAAAPAPPPPLLDQLADEGRLVIPVGSRGLQHLQVWQRSGRDVFMQELITVTFVPLRGQFGWDDSSWWEN